MCKQRNYSGSVHVCLTVIEINSHCKKTYLPSEGCTVAQSPHGVMVNLPLGAGRRKQLKAKTIHDITECWKDFQTFNCCLARTVSSIADIVLMTKMIDHCNRWAITVFCIGLNARFKSSTAPHAIYSPTFFKCIDYVVSKIQSLCSDVISMSLWGTYWSDVICQCKSCTLKRS